MRGLQVHCDPDTHKSINIRRNAAKRPIRLDELGPNSREVARRMIKEGELLPVDGGYILNEVKKI